MSNESKGFPGIWTAVRHFVWVASGGTKVQGAAIALDAASDTPAIMTGEMTPDRLVRSLDCVDMRFLPMGAPGIDCLEARSMNRIHISLCKLNWITDSDNVSSAGMIEQALRTSDIGEQEY
jgi:hypothetical protein